MYIIQLEAKPNVKTKEGKRFTKYGGAYINSWINYKDIDGAVFLAKQYIKNAGWIPTQKAEIVKIKMKECKKNQLKHYQEAMKYGYSNAYYLWPRNAPDAHKKYK